MCFSLSEQMAASFVRNITGGSRRTSGWSSIFNSEESIFSDNAAKNASVPVPENPDASFIRNILDRVSKNHHLVATVLRFYA